MGSAGRAPSDSRRSDHTSDLRLYAARVARGEDAGDVLIHDSVYLAAPSTRVDAALSVDASRLVREALGTVSANPMIALVADLVDHTGRPRAEGPEPDIGTPRRHADRVLVPLLWTPVPSNPLVCGFDGDLAYAPLGESVTQLALSGTCDTTAVPISSPTAAERFAQLAIRAVLEQLAHGLHASL